jgi:hypothetical protein
MKKYLTKEEAIRQVRAALGEETQDGRDNATRNLIRQKMAEAQAQWPQVKRVG